MTDQRRTPRDDHKPQRHLDLCPRQGGGPRLLRQQARAPEGQRRPPGRLPLAHRSCPGPAGHRGLAGAAGLAAARRSDRRATPGAHHQGRAGWPRVYHRRRSRPLRHTQGPGGDRLHPGAHGPLLRHRHGYPRSVRQSDPDPPAGEGRSEGDRLIDPSKGANAVPRTKTSIKPTSAARKGVNVWTDQERAAMQAGARERKASVGRMPGEAGPEGLQDLRESLAKMPAEDRAMGERIHEIVTTAVPALVPKTYYGMPAYAREGKDGKVIAFFKPKSKFRVRYSTFGFQADASLDEGDMWPTEFAVTKLTPGVEKRIADLVKKAAG